MLRPFGPRNDTTTRNPNPLQNRVDVSQVIAVLEQAVQIAGREPAAAEQALPERFPSLVRCRGCGLDDAVGLVTRQPLLQQRQKHPVAEDQPAGAVQICAHRIRVDSQPAQHDGHLAQHVVQQRGRAGNCDALH